MAEIAREIPPIRAQTLEELIRVLEEQLQRMQQEIWQIRQFLEPAVKLNEDSPNQQFNPLE